MIPGRLYLKGHAPYTLLLPYPLGRPAKNRPAQPPNPAQQYYHPDHQDYDPIRRLIAAIALRAVKDLVRPVAGLSHEDQQTALWFIATYRQLYRTLGIPPHKIETLLQRYPAHDPPSEEHPEISVV